MSKNYQIIEPPALAGLLASSTDHDIAVALRSWLIDRLRDDLPEHAATIALVTR